MNDFDEATRSLPHFQLDEAARQRHRVMVANLPNAEQVQTPGPHKRVTRRRRAGVLAASTAAACLAGVSVAAAVGAFNGQPSNTVVAYCYAKAELRGDDGNRMAFSSFTPNGTDTDTLNNALEICSDMWRKGQLRDTEPHIVGLQSIEEGADFPVPPLTECILPNGALAVLPSGDPEACAALGLEPRTNQ